MTLEQYSKQDSWRGKAPQSREYMRHEDQEQQHDRNAGTGTCEGRSSSDGEHDLNEASHCF